jgi:hypothetical protein
VFIFFNSYIVFTIYCLGFIYSFPRFFEYKTEVQHERLFLMDNITEDIDYLVITNKVLENRLYHYIVHLGKKNIFHYNQFILFLFDSFVQSLSKYITIINVIIF